MSTYSSNSLVTAGVSQLSMESLGELILILFHCVFFLLCDRIMKYKRFLGTENIRLNW